MSAISLSDPFSPFGGWAHAVLFLLLNVLLISSAAVSIGSNVLVVVFLNTVLALLAVVPAVVPAGPLVCS